VKWWRLITNNDLHTTTAECGGKYSPPGPGSSLLPSQWIQISVWKFHSNYWHLPFLLSKGHLKS
jgi:hypothetical protein